MQNVSAGALMDIVKLGMGAAIICASAIVPRQGVAFRPIVDENALASIEAVWPKDDSNPLRHRLLVCVRNQTSGNWPTI
jgi:LysR family hydrogen peroxide-inducible transcriptional activator